MASLNDIVRRQTDLSSDEGAHLRRLVGSWGPLADLCFADLLLYTPVQATDGQRFVCLGQIRPTTAQTMYRDDLIGRYVTGDERPMVRDALATGEILQKESDLPDGERATVMAVPVRCGNRVIAVLTRETTVLGHRQFGDLELAYLNVFERLVQMISEGVFPFSFEDPDTEVSPRVGDGALVLDGELRVIYPSPNAVSAFHRLGYHGNFNGRPLDDIGFRSETVPTLLKLQVPVVEELERGDSVTIMARILPLVDQGRVDGGLVLLRDVSEIRSRERLLVSMDATIREIHHRVKNNLQTVSSLLRIQGRRVSAPEAKAAIADAQRRIGSIAAVHELLSRGGGDDVVFGDVVRPILQMAEASLVPVQLRLVGEGPVLSTTAASSLAVILNELVQNAVEHGFPAGSDGGTVTVELVYTASELTIRVHDDGVGVPDGFEIDGQSGMGLTIINTLAKGDLNGTLTIRPATAPQPGTVAELTVQVDPR
ncbi:MAG: sensor histidine kinase [Actinomycetota bacterium]